MIVLKEIVSLLEKQDWILFQRRWKWDINVGEEEVVVLNKQKERWAAQQAQRAQHSQRAQLWSGVLGREAGRSHVPGIWLACPEAGAALCSSCSGLSLSWFHSSEWAAECETVFLVSSHNEVSPGQHPWAWASGKYLYVFRSAGPGPEASHCEPVPWMAGQAIWTLCVSGSRETRNGVVREGLLVISRARSSMGQAQRKQGSGRSIGPYGGKISRILAMKWLSNDSVACSLGFWVKCGLVNRMRKP